MPTLRFAGLPLLALALGCNVERFTSLAPSDACAEPSCPQQDAQAPGSSEPTGSASATHQPPSPEGGAPTETELTSDDVSAPEAGPPPPEPAPPGASCEAPSNGRVRAHFEVPGAEGTQPGDYFRLPFPNNFYLSASGLDLGDFPRVTTAAGTFVDALARSARGFGASPTVLFRFSGKVNFSDSLVSRFHLLDITDPASVSGPPLKLLYSPGAGKYVCHNWLGARPSPGFGLVPGHTYAAWIDMGVLDEDGLEVERSAQFGQVLDAAVPTDPVLADLHAKYEPFRAYLAVQGTDPAAVLNATVFSVDEVREPMMQLAARVQEQLPATASSWTRCDAGVTSPCSDASEGRACAAAADEYEEYHALVQLPIFQAGNAPYLESGGEINLQQVVRTEAVCMSLTVPRGTPPEEGFPIVLFAHGAGGSFRSAVRAEIAGNLSQVALPSGRSLRLAVLSYDSVQHGPRRGTDPLTSNTDPELLLFNFFNPLGTLGTSLQGGADVLSMARFARGLVLPVEVSGRADAFFDVRNVLFWGHSQGAMQGAIALPYSDDVGAAVFSGLGAGFLHSLLLRSEPAIVPQAVRTSVADPGADGELVFGMEYHPALSLVQQLVDAAEPLHHARLLVSSVQSNPLHVFQVYGTADAYSPALTQRSFATAAGLDVVQTDVSANPAEDLGELAAAFPLVGNVVLSERPFTAGVRQYGPAAGRNGHFVAYDVATANEDIAVFLGMAAGGEVPQIGR